MKKLITVLALIALTAFSACKNKTALDSNGMPQTLTIAVVQAEGIDEIKKIREQMRDYLQEKLKIPVELIYSNDYTGVIEALRANKAHMADMQPFAYVIASRTLKLNPLVTLGNNGKPTTYKSVIMANAHGSIKTMDDVKARAKKLTLAFVEPASASGHLIPRAYLNSIGLNPDTAFKQTIFAGNHLTSVLSVKSGKVDIGCTTNLVFMLMTKAKMINDGDIRVLWTSDPIVSDPIVVKSDINKDLQKRIQQAYLDMNKERPDILKAYVKIFIKDTTRRSYMVANDTLYNGLRKIAGSIKSLKAN
ncbi:phosphate/phosphite/phosphonate ABC transporter substrate-binding protein [Mucilaginibacter sp. cycad4]|uniref:phosphate/phosphite/phosphonate ABC transporter substrate-binding protein n=1 Tax=Mucilaginibacter sp. cycad4 TaxID=3342096 RepID=UPI002AAA9FE8|nr:phosphate/phosphite/phosphonate ABC transporter substrate-binding protein [Mucilaginibacter gossypii]WPV00769.1 phosphate/phosphite/phosphonate ABC transporter substrate-binding protein [Mucilaginibacter gossypii]